MYKILLADDEGIVIDSLKFIIEKEFPGECEFATAKTGRGVIETAEDFQPDIAFMDIQMPGINGIDAMREIKKVNSHTIFIVMTAYDKFDYAKEAISLGVLDYLNKPVARDKIVATMKKAFAMCDANKQRRSQDLLVKEKLETVVPIIENGFIQDLLFKEYFQEDIDNYKNLLSIDQDYGYMAAIVMGRELVGNHMTNAVAVSIEAQRVYNQIRALIEDYVPGKVGSVMSNKIPVFVPWNSSEMDYAARADLVEKGRALCRRLKEKNENMSFRIGFGPVLPLKRMNESYELALGSLVQSTGHVAHADDAPAVCLYEEDYPIELENQIFEAVRRGATSDAGAAASDFYDWMAGNYPDHVENIRLKVLEFALWAEHESYSIGGRKYEFLSRGEYLPVVNGFEDLDEMKLWFVSKVRAATEAVANRKEDQSNSVISKAISYIENNFTKELSLDEVSRVVNVSPYYFSKLFKEEKGENFVEYLTRIRMEKAKQLLTTSDMSMKEICREIGYSDPNYFSRNFKKFTGMTPTEYARK
ncbi:MAG: helix-turn-helix domain-containing protein [Bacteroidaceae bacterium]|nr:helix-turn-helix domain-containing protein [Bacteroidaceae bacterium]